MTDCRKFTGDKLVFATGNHNKVLELKDMLAGHVDEVLCSADLGLPDVVEDGLSFIENARIKAEAAALATGIPAVADDSGLCVAAMNGRPGIHSARYAVEAGGFAKGMSKILTELKGQADRKAYFACSLALCWPDDHCVCVEGRVHGRIIDAPRGGGGFGYDPIFLPDGFDQTFAEMSAAEKCAISHRSNAFHELVKKCFD